MKVVFVLAPGPAYGLERVVLEGARALSDQGPSMTLVVIREGRAPEHAALFVEAARERGLHTEIVSVSGRISTSLVLELGRLCKCADIIHAHGAKALLHAVAALGRPARHRLFVTCHGFLRRTRSERLYARLEAVASRAARRVFAVSGPLRDELVSLGARASNIEVVENPLSSEPTPLRQRTASSPLRLVFLGRLSAEKGLRELFEALAPVAKGFALEVCGDGHERSGLEARARQLGLAVSFSGFVEDVREPLERADAFVLTSHHEGLPISLLEATCAGLPVIASRVGGIPSVVEDGVTGLLLPPREIDALTAAFRTLADQYERFERAARHAAPVLRERYSPRAWAARTISAYVGA